MNRLELLAQVLRQIKEGLVKMSGYKGYDEADNVKRKLNNLGEDTGLKSMPHFKQWSKRGVDTPANEAKKLKAKSKKNKVTIITDPKEIEAKMKEMGKEVTSTEKADKKSIYEK